VRGLDRSIGATATADVTYGNAVRLFGLEGK